MTGALSFVLLAGIASGKLKNPDPIPSTPVPIAFEESDSVRHAIADLGVGKPITLVEKNIDVTFRNIFGKETVKQIGTRSGYPSFHTKWTGPAAVELLPRLPRGKYRIEVELCHVSAGVSSQVAIFLGGQYWNSPQGQHMHCLSIIYDDASPNIVKQLDWQTDSRVEFATLLAGELYEKPSHWETREFGHFNFKKPDPDIKNTQLRRLKFEVRETSVLAWWDDHYLGTIDIDTYQTKLRRAKAGYPPPIDMGDTAEPLWDGRLGIIVCNGTVNIKEFSITPLP